ncbi:MAG: hypothetical protein M3337_03765 [Actinomycetota bacterium]|nr:hypothetical protein [Actinomycetota bacterium]
MRKTLAALAVSTLAFAACGDDDDTMDPDDDTDITAPDLDDDDDDDGDDTDVTDAGSDDDTDVTDAGSDDTDGGDDAGSADDMMDNLRQQLLDLGLTEEQADCVLDKSLELGMEGGGAMPSQDELLGVYEECDVDFADLQPGG